MANAGGRAWRISTLVVAALAGGLLVLTLAAWRSNGPVIVVGASREAPTAGVSSRDATAARKVAGGQPSYVVAGHAQLSVPDNGWRPASLRVEATCDGPRWRLLRLASTEGFSLTRRVEGGATTTIDFDLDAFLPTSPRPLLDLHVTDETGAPAAVTLRAPRVTAHVVTPQGLIVAWAGAVIGALAWLALPIAAPARRRLFMRHAAPAWQGILAAVVTIPVAAALPVVPLQHATALVQAPVFGCALLILVLAGRVLRRSAGRRGPHGGTWDPAAALLIDLVVGIVGLAVAFAWWSLVLKRLVGVDRVPVWAFPALAVVVVVTLAAAVRPGRHRLPPTALPPTALPPTALPPTAVGCFSVRDALILAVIVAALCAIGGPHLATINAYSSDPDQHVGWTAQVIAHGLVPDRYFASGLYIDYPLGLHAMATVVSLFGVLPPGTAIAMLPVVASFVSIAIFVLGMGHVLRRPEEWTWREWLAAALGIGAMSVALSSSQFSIWQAYQGTGRLVAGLVQVVPILVLVSAFRAGPRPVTVAGQDGGGPRVVAALVVAGAVALWLNPGLVPLQVILSLLALAALAWRHRPAWRAGLRAMLAGLLVGGAIAAGVLVADPWSSRRLLKAVGSDVADAASLDRAMAHHNSSLHGASCLTWRCITDVLSFSRALDHAVLPWAVVAFGPLDVARGVPPAPIEPDGDWRVRRFPDVTNRAFSPHHGRSAFTFAVVSVCLLLLAPTRRGRRALVVLALLLAAASLDVIIGDVANRLIRPDDAQWKLLAPYMVRNGSRLLTQVFWASAFAAVGFWLAGVGGRVRRVAGLAAWSALALWTMMDAGAAVRTGTTDLDLPFRHLRPADLADATALIEAHVPVGESLLTPSRHVYINGRHWLFPDVAPRQDVVGPLHVQARRAALFLYQFEHGARVSPFDYLAACREFEAGGLPRLVRETRARWALEVADQGDTATVPLAGRSLCERPVRTLFPTMRVVATRGRVRLYRLWN